MLFRIPNSLLTLTISVLSILINVHSANAQTMYRCGSTYQDTPCQSTPANKTFQMVTGSKAASSVAAPVSDVQCSGRGAEALKLTWQREAGKTLEQQLTGITSPTQRALIEETYSIRGTAPEVRSAIEMACIKRKEEALKAAALIEAARAMDGAARPAGSQQTISEAPQAKVQTSEAAKTQNRTDSARAQARCESFQTQITRVKDQQRQGGSIQLQEDLSAQRRDLERRSSEAKC